MFGGVNKVQYIMCDKSTVFPVTVTLFMNLLLQVMRF